MTKTHAILCVAAAAFILAALCAYAPQCNAQWDQPIDSQDETLSPPTTGIRNLGISEGTEQERDVEAELQREIEGINKDEADGIVVHTSGHGIAVPEGTDDAELIDTVDDEDNPPLAMAPPPTAAPQREGFNFRRLASVFYGPDPDEVTGDARYGYDHTLAVEESKFVVACRILRAQRVERPGAFWGFWALLLALILYPCLRRRAKRNATEPKAVPEAANAQNEKE